MDKNYHILQSGRLKRHENTLKFVDEGGEQTHVPVETVEAIFCHEPVTYNTRLLGLLNDHGIELHAYGWNDQYVGSHLPRRGRVSGQTVVAQATSHADDDECLRIAREFVRGSIFNMRRNLRYYQSTSDEYASEIAALDRAEDAVSEAPDVPELMGVEATARKAYYSTFDDVLADFEFDGRTYNPPESEVNALISFGNSLVYASVTSAIRKTALDPTVGFLHSPGERRFSLALDIADVFKPVLADRLIFRLVNRGQIDQSDFRDDIDGYLLTEDGRKTFLKEYEALLETTVEHPDLNRKVSYQYLLRLEAYALQKHVVTGEPYEAFRRWW